MEKCYALVLAGGKSSRIGTDKAKMVIEGESLLEKAVNFWKSSNRVSKIYVSVGYDDHFNMLPEGSAGIPDIIEGKGPMVGILSAFKETDADVLYVSAVDMPNLSTDMILPLPKGDVAVYKTKGGLEPLFAVYRRSTLSVMEELLEKGEGKLSLIFDKVNTEVVTVPEDSEEVFYNINRLEDIDRYLQQKIKTKYC